MKPIQGLWHWYRNWRFVLVCLVMIVLLISDSVVHSPWPRHILTMLLVFIVASQVSRLVFSRVGDDRRRAMLTAVLTLAVIGLELHLIFWTQGENGISLFFIVLFALGVVSMVMRLFNTDEVDVNAVFAGILGYLLLAMLGTVIFLYINHHVEAAFVLGGQRGSLLQGSQALYFSLVTITTLGYGDIVPHSDQARVVAALLAVSGQLYVAIIIARLVALYMRERLDAQKEAVIQRAVEKALATHGLGKQGRPPQGS